MSEERGPILKLICDGELKTKDSTVIQLKFNLEWKLKEGLYAYLADVALINAISNKTTLNPCSFRGRITEGIGLKGPSEIWRTMINQYVFIKNASVSENGTVTVNSTVLTSDREFYFHDKKGRFEFHLVNFDFISPETEIDRSMSMNRNVLRINIEGNEFLLLKTTRKSKDELPLCKLIVLGSLEQNSEIEEQVDDLCHLISFMTGDYVDYYKFDYYEGDEMAPRYSSSKGTLSNAVIQNNQPLISELPPTDYRDFIENSFNNYKLLKDELELKYIVEYYTKIRREEYLEIKCLLCFILLECLADKAKEYYKKINDPIRNPNIGRFKSKLREIDFDEIKKLSDEAVSKLADALAIPYPPLPALIKHIMSRNNMQYEDKESELWGWRKDFVHKGLSTVSPSKTYQKRYLTLIHFIDRLILSILHYNGPYCNAKKRWERK